MNNARNYIFGSGGAKSLLVGLIAYWKLDNNLLDSFSTHNGTATSISYTTGISNNGINFTGTGQKADFGSSTSFQFSDGVSTDYPFSISYWVKYTVLGSYNFMLRKENSGFLSYLGNGGKGLKFLISKESAFSNYLAIESESGTLSLNTWTHIVNTYDGSKTNAGMKIYKNGSLLSTINLNSGTYTVMNNTGNSNIYIASSVSYARYIADEIGLWNKVLTPSEVTNLYNAGVGKFYPF